MPRSIDIAHHRVTASDGEALRAFSAGGGDGPTIVLCNGLLGGIEAWRELIEDFAPFHRIIGWQLRSAAAHRDRKEALMSRHAEDLGAILEHFEVTGAVGIGWSLGSRPLLEAMQRWPDRFAAGVVICGVLARPIQRALQPFAGPLAGLAPALSELAAEIAPYAPSIWQAAGVGARSRTVHDVLRLVGAVSSSVASPRLGELLARTMATPLPELMTTLRALDYHVQQGAMPDLDAPILLIAGTADPLCPVADVQRAAGALLDAETMIVPSAGHLLPLEFTELVQLRIARFVRLRCGYDRLAGVAAPASAS